ncbi:MAG: hypothetical protein H7343_20130 [Undibacterium sp.]|nr:hypothetical protein [Opitutaceae bacterium]
MRSEPLRLSPRLRAWTYSAFGVLFASGAAWWLLQQTKPAESELGLRAHVASTWLLRLHGAAAMLVLVILGLLLSVHVARGWQARKNRFSGVSMLALCALLIASGWLLYYASGETVRAGASVVHIGAGFILPILLVLHIVIGRSTRRPAATTPPST